MNDELVKAIIEYLSKTPVFLITILCVYMQGVLVLIVFNGLVKKRLKKIFAFPVGTGCSSITLVVLNFESMVTSQFSLQMLEARILPSTLLTFGIIGIVTLAVFTVKEICKLKGGNGNG